MILDNFLLNGFEKTSNLQCASFRRKPESVGSNKKLDFGFWIQNGFNINANTPISKAIETITPAENSTARQYFAVAPSHFR
jgi:hypothetical protein